MRIGMDLDGPNLGFAENYYDGCRTVLGLPIPDPAPPALVWEFFRDVGHEPADFVRNCHELADSGHLFRAEPLPGSVEAWRRLVDAGHTIHVVTDRSFGIDGGQPSRNATVAWLLDHEYPFHSITFAADKTSVDVDVFVEDKAENFHALWDAGTVCYLVDRPWNAHVETLRHRVADVAEFADRVIPIAAELESLRSDRAGVEHRLVG